MRKILESCPTCGGEFAVTELTCTTCDTVVRSRYSPCPFCRLAPEDLAFLLVFVRNRGNVKDMERELGVSYWTIRGRLTELITAMGLEPGGEPDDDAPAPSHGEGDQTSLSPRERAGERGAPRERAGERGAPRERAGERGAPQERAGETGAPRQRAGERAASAARQATLDRLRRGEITAEEAANELRITN